MSPRTRRAATLRLPLSSSPPRARSRTRSSTRATTSSPRSPALEPSSRAEMTELPPLPGADERSPIAADFLARWQAQLLLCQRRRGLQGAEGIRSDLELAPHQARTLLEVLSAPRVRHVLADEVG